MMVMAVEAMTPRVVDRLGKRGPQPQGNNSIRMIPSWDSRRLWSISNRYEQRFKFLIRIKMISFDSSWWRRYSMCRTSSETTDNGRKRGLRAHGRISNRRHSRGTRRCGLDRPRPIRITCSTGASRACRTRTASTPGRQRRYRRMITRICWRCRFRTSIRTIESKSAALRASTRCTDRRTSLSFTRTRTWLKTTINYTKANRATTTSGREITKAVSRCINRT